MKVVKKSKNATDALALETSHTVRSSQGEANKVRSGEIKQCGPSPLPPSEIKALVEGAARRHEVDTAFATAIVQAESNFDQVRTSKAGALGPMQLMPATADRFGVADPCEPKANIEAGVKYLRQLLDEFENPMLAAAAYNSGSERIYQYGGIPPFKETVGYVAKVMNYQLGRALPQPKTKPASPNVASNRGARSGVMSVEKSGNFVAGVMHF